MAGWSSTLKNMADLKFKPLEHPSDIGLIAYGKDKKEVLQNAALGMFSLMADLDKVKGKDCYEIKVSGDDQESLLVNWLNELIFIQDSKKVLLNEFKISKLSDKELSALVCGEKIDLKKHIIQHSIKAATFNQLQLSENQAKIIFDV